MVARPILHMERASLSVVGDRAATVVMLGPIVVADRLEATASGTTVVFMNVELSDERVVAMAEAPPASPIHWSQRGIWASIALPAIRLTTANVPVGGEREEFIGVKRFWIN